MKVGIVLHLTFFSRKENKTDTIDLKHNDKGWIMSHSCYDGQTDPCGSPHLRRCIEDNYTPYPPAFGDAIEEVWEALQTERLPEAEAQKHLDRFSVWLRVYEKNQNISMAELS